MFRGFDLTGRVAVVLGGTSGLGQAMALGLAAAGADVVASGRGTAAVEETAAAIEELGRRTLRVAADVASRASLEHLHDACLQTFERVDILVNAAGRTQRIPTLTLSDEDWAGTLTVNLDGVLRACQIFGRGMCERGTGRIINIASLTSFVGFMEVAAYTASKAGLVGLTRALAVEWAARGVTVNAIAPGVFPTALNRTLLEGTPRGQELLLRTPMRRFGRPEELAGAAVFLASDASSFITGHTLVVDGGFLSSGVNQ
jgi:NAD(P)-dependent dehydrogenase (short-subunit alcohol dehydrogenase family)